MINIKQSRSALAIFSVLALGACGTMNSPQTTSSNYPPSTNSGSASSTYGVVQSIDLVRGDNADKSIGFGTLAGAVVGGVVGSQIGDGRGNTAATVAGAAGGAYAGHQIEKGNRAQADAYKITVRMNNGAFQTVTQSTSGDLRIGDRVQVDGGVARRY